jgi:hypothetical protein
MSSGTLEMGQSVPLATVVVAQLDSDLGRARGGAGAESGLDEEIEIEVRVRPPAHGPGFDETRVLRALAPLLFLRRMHEAGNTAGAVRSIDFFDELGVPTAVDGPSAAHLDESTQHRNHIRRRVTYAADGSTASDVYVLKRPLRQSKLPYTPAHEPRRQGAGAGAGAGAGTLRLAVAREMQVTEQFFHSVTLVRARWRTSLVSPNWRVDVTRTRSAMSQSALAHASVAVEVEVEALAWAACRVEAGVAQLQEILDAVTTTAVLVH